VNLILQNEEESISKKKYSEAELIGPLKQLEAGSTAAEVGHERSLVTGQSSVQRAAVRLRILDLPRLYLRLEHQRL
jgi:hypothetical protein